MTSASIAQWQSVGLVNQRSWVQSSLEAQNLLTYMTCWQGWKLQNNADPDVIWTRSLLIWSQTRYHCATESIRFHRDFCTIMCFFQYMLSPVVLGLRQMVRVNLDFVFPWILFQIIYSAIKIIIIQVGKPRELMKTTFSILSDSVLPQQSKNG